MSMLVISIDEFGLKLFLQVADTPQQFRVLTTLPNDWVRFLAPPASLYPFVTIVPAFLPLVSAGTRYACEAFMYTHTKQPCL